MEWDACAGSSDWEDWLESANWFTSAVTCAGWSDWEDWLESDNWSTSASPVLVDLAAGMVVLRK